MAHLYVTGANFPEGERSPHMVSLLVQDARYLQPGNESLDVHFNVNRLCSVLPGEFRAKKMSLRRSVPALNGDRMDVEIAIAFEQRHSLDAEKLSQMIWRSCQECFEYALQTSHSKTIVSGLYDRGENPVGEIIATFRPSPGLPLPVGPVGA
jgi:hypothetical protein